jgi:hypothetical protein
MLAQHCVAAMFITAVLTRFTMNAPAPAALQFTQDEELHVPVMTDRQTDRQTDSITMQHFMKTIEDII